MHALTDPFTAPFMQRALGEVLLLAVAGGLLGTWVVLRRLSFYTHAVGTATFPGLVVAGPWGIQPQVAALGAGLGFAALLERAVRSRRLTADAGTGLLLVAALALGAVLASDVYRSGAGVDRLLFGTLVGLGPEDVRLSAGVALLAVLGTAVLGRAWLAAGFDPAARSALGIRTAGADLALLALIAVAVVASLSAVGALLVSALFVVPAATVRLFAPSVCALQAGSVALAALEGVAGLWLAYRTDAPPGATIAVLGGGVFALASLGRALGARRAGVLAAAAAAVALVAGCGTSSSGNGAKLHVVATTTQVGDFARQVGGPRVQVTQILGANADPHEYEPRPSDATGIAAADVVFRSGGDVDDWLAGVVKNAGGHATVVDLSTAVHLRHQGGKLDPHWWHDPRNVALAVARIRDALIKADPQGAGSYRQRARAYLARVTRLDRALAACLGRIPPAQRELVTNHDAFGYFAARYGVKVLGAVIPSLSTQAQPSAGATAKLVRLIRRTGVKAIFAEKSVNPALERNIAREAGARVVSSLYGDALGARGSTGATWLDATASNGEQISAGLSGGKVRCTLPR